MEASRFPWVRTPLTQYLLLVLIMVASVALSIEFAVAAGMHWAFVPGAGVLFLLTMVITTVTYLDVREGGTGEIDQYWPQRNVVRIGELPDTCESENHAGSESPSKGRDPLGEMAGVQWAELRAPKQPGVYRVSGIGDVVITESDIETATTLGGNPWFELTDVTQPQDKTRKLRVGVATPQQREPYRQGADSFSSRPERIRR